jgi:hypothetical protein
MATGTQLESWSGIDWSEGVQVDELHELDALSIRTRNSTYEIIVTGPDKAQVLVRGGAHFPSFTNATLRGSTIGGCILKRGVVYPGFRLELETDGRRIITSAVESIDLNPPSPEQ